MMGKFNRQNNMKRINASPIPEWDRYYIPYKEWDARVLAVNKLLRVPCRCCGKPTADFGRDYYGLCSDCWSAILLYCMDGAAKWLDAHPGKWPGEKRPDTQLMALARIRALCRTGHLGHLVQHVLGRQLTPYSDEESMQSRMRDNRDMHRESSRKYYLAHREEIREYRKAYRQRNKEKMREYMKEYMRRRRKKEAATS